MNLMKPPEEVEVLDQLESNMKEIKSFKDLLDLFEEMYGDAKKENIKEDTPKCPKKEAVAQPCEKPSNIELSKDVFMVDENSYLLCNKVNGTNISENTEIIFDHVDEDVVVPGITEDQLLCILLYRNRNKGERYNLIKQLLHTR